MLELKITGSITLHSCYVGGALRVAAYDIVGSVRREAVGFAFVLTSQNWFTRGQSTGDSSNDK